MAKPDCPVCRGDFTYGRPCPACGSEDGGNEETLHGPDYEGDDGDDDDDDDFYDWEDDDWEGDDYDGDGEEDLENTGL